MALAGDDTIYAGAGATRIFPGDTVHGGDGSDLIYGGPGGDGLYGGLYWAGITPPEAQTDSSNDYIHGGRGRDSIQGGFA